MGRFEVQIINLNPENICVSAGNRTRVDCLEGNHANPYTTDATVFASVKNVERILSAWEVDRNRPWPCVSLKQKAYSDISSFVSDT